MDPANLQTAATYVNNLLLARGLLRNGKPVNFAALIAPAETGGEKNSNGRAGDKEPRRCPDGDSANAETVVQVINLVHDMILRRDRDQESHTSLSTTLTTLRTSHSTATTTVTRLQDRNTDLRRQLETSHAATRAAQHAAHAAEVSARALRDELVRARNTLGQVRTQCANDVRRRDVELRRLKGHLSDTQRGTHGAGAPGRSVGASCTVSGGGRSLGLGAAAGAFGGSARRETEVAPSLEDAGYSLQQETTGFLTQLSQSMSEENDALIALVRETLVTLRGLMDLPAGPAARDGSVPDDEFVTVVPMSYEVLAGDLQFVLGRLQALLTRDDFVPISEVYARDEEIQRLRDGWEKIGARWSEAVEMMKAWQERMVKSGDTVNLAELKAGLNLGEGLRLMEAAAPATGAEEDETELDHSRSELDPIADADVIFADVQAMSSSPVPSPPVSAALREASSNIVSPTSLTARVRKLRLQASQKAQEQQENAATGSPPSRSPSSSLRSDRALNSETEPPKQRTKTTRAAPPPASRAHLSTRPAARLAQPSTRTRPNGTRSRTSPACTSASTSNRAVPRSPFHTHLNSLLTSSSVSSPEKEDREPVRPSHSSRSHARPNLQHVRTLSSTSNTTPPSHAPSPSKSPPSTRAQARRRTLHTTSPPTALATRSPHDGDGLSDDPEADADASAPPGMSVSDKLRHAESEARRVSGFALSSSPAPAPPQLSPARCVDADAADGVVLPAAVPHADLEVEGRAGQGAARVERETSRREQTVRVRSPVKASPVRPVKRGDVRVRGTLARRGRRRKSTLSPEELEALMGLRSPGEG